MTQSSYDIKRGHGEEGTGRARGGHGDEGTGEVVGYRTSHSADIGRRYDRVLAKVEARVARFAGLPEVHSEPMQIQRYQGAQEYREHSDCFDLNEANVCEDCLRE